MDGMVENLHKDEDSIMGDKRILDENRLRECKEAYDLYKTGKYAHRDIAEMLKVSHSTVQRRISLYEHHMHATGGQQQKPAAPVSDSHNGDYQFSAWKPKPDVVAEVMEALLTGDRDRATRLMGAAIDDIDVPQHSVRFPDSDIPYVPVVDRQGDELASYTAKIEKSKQRLQDTLKHERKTKREAYKLVSALEAQTEELIDLYRRHAPKSYRRRSYPIDGKAPVGILHLSDLHMNEVVETAANHYDIKVAARRLRFFVDSAVRYMKASGVKKVLVAGTGDFLKNAKRLDEVMNNTANRMAMTFLVAEVIGQILEHLLDEGFEVHFAGVCGNESRTQEELGTTRVVVGESFDYAVYATLYYRFRDVVGFVIGEDPGECLVEVNGQGVLLMHGHMGGRGTPQAKAQKAISRYASHRTPTIVRLAIMGHIHEAFIGDYIARSSSPVGGNAYSDQGLGLISRASQNLYLVWPEMTGGGFDGIKIDLQRTPEDYPAYDTTDSLAVYNRSILAHRNGEHRPYAVA